MNEIKVFNATLRERFEVNAQNVAIVSRIIKATMSDGLIKLADEKAA